MKVYKFDGPTPQGSAPLDKQMFLHAIDFHEGAVRAGMKEHDPEGAPVDAVHSMVVCYAFAAELYLKCLLTMGASMGLIKGHKLHVLYGRLDAQVQADLAAAYELVTGRPDKALKYDLAKFTGAFQEWRYIYEGEGQQIHTNLLAAFAKAAYMTVRKHRPDWEVRTYQDERLQKFVSPTMTLVNLGGGVFVHAVDGTDTLNAPAA